MENHWSNRIRSLTPLISLLRKDISTDERGLRRKESYSKQTLSMRYSTYCCTYRLEKDREQHRTLSKKALMHWTSSWWFSALSFRIRFHTFLLVAKAMIF